MVAMLSTFETERVAGDPCVDPKAATA